MTVVVSLSPETGNSALKNYLRIAVMETGIGIGSETINKLFQPFVQIDSALMNPFIPEPLTYAADVAILHLPKSRSLS